MEYLQKAHRNQLIQRELLQNTEKMILDKIIAHKRKEVANTKALTPIALLEQSIYFKSPCVSLSEYIKKKDKSGIIAEFKRRSPSKPHINPYASVEEVSIGYMQAGASALSILTDAHFFEGQNSDLTTARKFNYCPILRKDFIISEYQVVEAKSIGADAILLIAAVLDRQEIAHLAALAKSLGMEVLLEVHNEDEIKKITEHIDILGVNNRNLTDFEVSMDNSLKMIDAIPDNICKISESGISSAESILKLRRAGYEGFLIGEHFMKSAHPGKICREFVKSITESILK